MLLHAIDVVLTGLTWLVSERIQRGALVGCELGLDLVETDFGVLDDVVQPGHCYSRVALTETVSHQGSDACRVFDVRASSFVELAHVGDGGDLASYERFHAVNSAACRESRTGWRDSEQELLNLCVSGVCRFELLGLKRESSSEPALALLGFHETLVDVVKLSFQERYLALELLDA